MRTAAGPGSAHRAGGASPQHASRDGDWDVWQTTLHNPDFSKYAQICGAFGVRVTDAGQLDDALMDAIAHDGPALVEVITDAELV